MFSVPFFPSVPFFNNVPKTVTFVDAEFNSVIDGAIGYVKNVVQDCNPALIRVKAEKVKARKDSAQKSFQANQD